MEYRTCKGSTNGIISFARATVEGDWISATIDIWLSMTYCSHVTILNHSFATRIAH